LPLNGIAKKGQLTHPNLKNIYFIVFGLKMSGKDWIILKCLCFNFNSALAFSLVIILNYENAFSEK
jgi:hypothetical protein